MSTLAYLAVFLFSGLIALFCWFIYDREMYGSIIREGFESDLKYYHERMKLVTESDGKRLIESFTEKWEKYVDGLEMAAARRKLYKELYNYTTKANLN